MFSFKGRLSLVAHRSRFAHKGFVRRQFHGASGDFAAEPSHAEVVQGGDHANDYLSTGHTSTLHNAEQEMHRPIPHRLAMCSATLIRPVSLRVMVLERLHEHVTKKGFARIEGEIKSTKNEGRGFFCFLVSGIMLGIGLKIWSYDVAMQEKYDNSLLRVQDRVGADMEKMEKRLEKGQERLEGELKLIQGKLEKLFVRWWF
ncbi:hypothetical protein HOY80DRAFT_953172 [Tuber brumale]|nr:hypothetical protein HOY80DRAFT_953172 [Tuber brumale]